MVLIGFQSIKIVLFIRLIGRKSWLEFSVNKKITASVLLEVNIYKRLVVMLGGFPSRILLNLTVIQKLLLLFVVTVLP